VIEAARLLSKPGWTVDAVADRFGWSVRRVHRQFVSTCGYGAKVLQRILRLQRAIRIAHAASSSRTWSLTHLAAAAGYADQSHMSREFRALTGFTPADYLMASDRRVGTWLDEDDHDNVRDRHETSGS
jgi:AraC-like DNA-binding protein